MRHDHVSLLIRPRGSPVDSVEHILKSKRIELPVEMPALSGCVEIHLSLHYSIVHLLQIALGVTTLAPALFKLKLFVTLIMLANVNEIHVAIEMLALSS